MKTMKPKTKRQARPINKYREPDEIAHSRQYKKYTKKAYSRAVRQEMKAALRRGEEE
jgi:hypothetical protein